MILASIVTPLALLALAGIFLWLFSPLSDDRWPPSPPARRPSGASRPPSAGASRSPRRAPSTGATGERADDGPAGSALLRPCGCGRPTTGVACSECEARGAAA